MQVRYLDWTGPYFGHEPKDLIKQIEARGTVANQLPRGDNQVAQVYFILGGRGSIARFLAASGVGNFYALGDISAYYIRVNKGIGKHYTLVAVAAAAANDAFTGTRKGYWNLLPKIRTGIRGGGVINQTPNTRAPRIDVLSYNDLQTALAQAESKMVGGIITHEIGI